MLDPKSESGTGADGDGARLESTGAGAGLDLAVVRSEEGGSRGGEELGSGGAGGGNRWPRQETLALLQIRSDMDGAFRESTSKGHLWDEVSRKMAEIGYRRSSKKCREKFENVYKYHRRTKDGRSGKSEGKTYRFFDQLEALESNNYSPFSLPPPEAAVPIAMAMMPPRPPASFATAQNQLALPSTTLQLHPPLVQSTNFNSSMNFLSSPSGTPPSSSSTSSDEDTMGTRSRRKRKWKDFFEKLTRDVMAKQEEFERKFLEAMDRRENERRFREEAWKAKETARLKHEHELLLHERSLLSAKESALVSFLQKLSDHHNIPLPPAILQSPPPPPPPPITTFQSPIPNSTTSLVPTPAPAPPTMQAMEIGDRTSSRWPKAEIDALINLRTKMEHKYQEGFPKGLFWEEISSAMTSLGYNRNAKRCKEKWENINKYYRRVKESNKKPRVDSKTCPYYYQLEALYAGAGAAKSTNSAPPPPDHGYENDGNYDDDYDEGAYEAGANGGGAPAAMES